ncbi:hypothetical protein K443DRAFT_666064, partial [Laccaria amethystina LaAM-08-1]
YLLADNLSRPSFSATQVSCGRIHVTVHKSYLCDGSACAARQRFNHRSRAESTTGGCLQFSDSAFVSTVPSPSTRFTHTRDMLRSLGRRVEDDLWQK